MASIQKVNDRPNNRKILWCGHAFHRNCIEQRFERKQRFKGDCPNCRRIHRSVLVPNEWVIMVRNSPDEVLIYCLTLYVPTTFRIAKLHVRKTSAEAGLNIFASFGSDWYECWRLWSSGVSDILWPRRFIVKGEYWLNLACSVLLSPCLNIQIQAGQTKIIFDKLYFYYVPLKLLKHLGTDRWIVNSVGFINPLQ